MRRIAIIGKPGGGKSTLSKKIAESKSIRLVHLDSIEYDQSGAKVPLEDYLAAHNNLINLREWIIDGFGPLESFWQRIEAADAVIYIDLPYRIHYWWLTKRLLQGMYKKPEGWPEGSSVIKGTIAGYRYLKLSPKFWTSKLEQEIRQRTRKNRLYSVKSVRELNNLAATLK
ncbi:MAG: hypothetical protein OQK51_13925 [Kangiellaceae bacterium]|nr:hypothetical protein [Kangiellaceae bacterium]